MTVLNFVKAEKRRLCSTRQYMTAIFYYWSDLSLVKVRRKNAMEIVKQARIIKRCVLQLKDCDSKRRKETTEGKEEEQ